MTRTKSKSRHINRRTKRSGTKRSVGGGLAESKLAPNLKPLPRDKIYVYLNTLAIAAPGRWIPPPPLHPSDVKELTRQSALVSTQSGRVKFLTDRLLAPASTAQDSLLAQNSQWQQTQRMGSALSNAHASLTVTLSRLSKITDLKKQLFNLLFSKNPIDCGRPLTNLADVPFLIDVILEKLKNMQTICSDMGPKCPLYHYPDKYKDIFNALVKCRMMNPGPYLQFIHHIQRTIVPPSTEPEALRTRFRFSPERMEALIHHFNGLKSVILTCVGSGSNPPLGQANPSLYAFLSRDAMNNSTLLHNLDKDEIAEFKEFIKGTPLIKTMTMTEVDAFLRTKYIKKIMDMIRDIYSGEEMELLLIAALGASQPLPDDPDTDPHPECDKLMARLDGLMPKIHETYISRIENLGDSVQFQ